MNKEIVIPQGYEARIEGNKVILEKNESEDKRIRKNLIEWVREFKKLNPTNPDHNAECSEAIDWLERQKEQKPEIKYVYPIFRVGDTIKPKAYNESHRIDEIKDDNYVLDNGFTFPIVDQDVWEIVEQPTEWSEEDEDALKYLHKLIDFGYSKDFTGAQTAAEMRRWVNKFLRPQLHWKPSEEEMQALSWAINYLTDIEQGCASTLALLKFNLKELL